MTKCCFVIQGFGKKQDYEQGKLFNLDASYEVIKEAVEEVGLECYRADELSTNSLIDQVMYNQLLDADLVIADITTLNFNAAYELGIRHALRPHATLVVGESGMNFPFDIDHIYIHTYQHLGEDIGYKEVKRFQGELKKLVKKAVDYPKNDSPVYTFLTHLPGDGFLSAARPCQKSIDVERGDTTLRLLIEQAKAAMGESRFVDAINLWTNAREIAKKNDYIVQQLALATYKSKEPDTETALRKAKDILQYLQPHGSFDTETLGLWAAVHKYLYEFTNDPDDLDEAIFALERGFFIKQDSYNGINLAFMLDVKAQNEKGKMKTDTQAVARFVRRKVKTICVKAIEAGNLEGDDKYWTYATIYEACVGLGQEEEAQRWKEEAAKLPKQPWMNQTTNDQIDRLRALLLGKY
jgi:hypothetical protein